MRDLLVFPVIGALICWSAAAASAATVNVPPGAGTLQAAIDAAAPGDTLVVGGFYTGPVVINKRLKIRIDKNAEMPALQIDGECTAAVGLTISADKVKTEGGPIHVFGATTTGVIVDGTTRSKIFTLSTDNTCGTATTGLVVRNTSRTSFSGGNVFYFTDTAMRIEDLGLKAKIKFWGFSVYGPATNGLVIENVADGAARKGADLSIRTVISLDITNGIVLTNADGVTIEKSNVTTGVTGPTVTIDAASANNLIRKTSVGATSDAGTDTCWKGNQGHVDDCP
jgi:nitrous oxidase accessory protein NosD